MTMTTNTYYIIHTTNGGRICGLITRMDPGSITLTPSGATHSITIDTLRVSRTERIG